jgi:outer membrane protein OmpA-like peptidoglycan-associated protein
MRMRSIFYLTVFAAIMTIIGCQGTRTGGPSPTLGQLDWWPTQAVPQPVDDPRPTYMGRWWWPTDPAAEVSPLWGNRGYVYVLKWSATDVEKVPKELKDVEALVLREVHFDFDKSELTPAAKEILRDAAAKLKQFPNAYVTIEGHTCSIGTDEYNKGLGKRRADSVKAFLISEDISPDRLTTVSYGEERLKVAERKPSDYAMNRRVEFEIDMR